MAGEEGGRAFVPDALTTVAAFERALRENAASSQQDSAHAKPPLLAGARGCCLKCCSRMCFGAVSWPLVWRRLKRR